MILQALTQYYEELLALGQIARPGWAKVRVTFALDLDEQGTLLGLLPLQTEQQRGKKTVLAPREFSMPMPVKRAVNVSANFLCDNSGYLLGVDAKGKAARTRQCFEASKALHLALLETADAPAAKAVCNFFSHWDPSKSEEHPALAPYWAELLKGGNLTFYYGDRPVAEDAAVQRLWQTHYGGAGENGAARCLVTGQTAPVARLHPNIKGVQGAQTAGAALVSFNAPSFCSYGHEQGANAPVSEYAAFAYTTALNTLIADRAHCRRVGDTTIVCWAEGGKSGYQDFCMASLLDDAMGETDILSALFRLAGGEQIEWDGTLLDPSVRFYVLGLAPNAARLSVRFFWQDTFGIWARNVTRHYARLEIVRPSFDKHVVLPVWRLLQETVNKNARSPAPAPRLPGDLLLAILGDQRYPATLLDGVALRIRAEHTVTRGRAAILKAYYLRNTQDLQIKEVMTVELNEQSNYMPYVLGRLFAVLEAVQADANPNINTTIRERYFNSASATPASVFPTLMNLGQKHLAKLGGGKEVYYNKQITDLVGRIQQTLPARLTLQEQGAFQIGYYHQTQKRFTKKEEQ